MLTPMSINWGVLSESTLKSVMGLLKKKSIVLLNQIN
jgi:hypothetical protein